MSTDPTMETPQSSQKSKKSKDRSEQKSSKKRRHEEQTTEHSEAVPESSPSKKPRIENDTIQQTSQAESQSQSQSQCRHSAANTVTDSTLESASPFVVQTTSFYLPLAPVAHKIPLQGLCAEHISPLLLSYYPPLHGILIDYTNPRLSSSPTPLPAPLQNPSSPSTTNTTTNNNSKETPHPTVLAKAIDEYAPTFIWLTADFTLLRPAKDTWIEGHVQLQNESYLGIVCYNFFNAAIERRRLPSDWVWTTSNSATTTAGNTEEEQAEAEIIGSSSRADAGAGTGYFIDAEGRKVEGKIRFRVRDFESAPSTERERGFVSIEGTLLSPEDDKALDDELRKKARGIDNNNNKKKKGRLL